MNLESFIIRRIGVRDPKAALEKVLRQQLAQVDERAAKHRAKNPPSPPVKNPTERQIEMMIEPSVEFSPDQSFRYSVLIEGKLYVVTSGCWWNSGRKNLSEFSLTELLPCNGERVVTRIGTTEHYSLGKTLWWRKGKIYPKSAALP